MPQPTSNLARGLIELEQLASRFHPRFAAQFAAGLLLREQRLAVAQDRARQNN